MLKSFFGLSSGSEKVASSLSLLRGDFDRERFLCFSGEMDRKGLGSLISFINLIINVLIALYFKTPTNRAGDQEDPRSSN